MPNTFVRLSFPDFSLEKWSGHTGLLVSSIIHMYSNSLPICFYCYLLLSLPSEILPFYLSLVQLDIGTTYSDMPYLECQDLADKDWPPEYHILVILAATLATTMLQHANNTRINVLALTTILSNYPDFIKIGGKNWWLQVVTLQGNA